MAEKSLPGGSPSASTLRLLARVTVMLADGNRTHKELELFSKGQNPFPGESDSRRAKKNRRGKADSTKTLDHLKRQLDLWGEFFKQVAGLDITGEKSLALPPYQTGFDWLVVRPKGLTAQTAFDLIGNHFPHWKYWRDLGALTVVENYLKPVDESVVILTLATIEAPNKLSYNQAVEQRLVFLSLTHRITMELFGWWLNRYHSQVAQELGIPEHLDPRGWTRTSSLDPGGGVASAYWDPARGGFGVGWSCRLYAYPPGGVRLAVH